LLSIAETWLKFEIQNGHQEAVFGSLINVK